MAGQSCAWIEYPISTPSPFPRCSCTSQVSQSYCHWSIPHRLSTAHTLYPFCLTRLLVHIFHSRLVWHLHSILIWDCQFYDSMSILWFYDFPPTFTRTIAFAFVWTWVADFALSTSLSYISWRTFLWLHMWQFWHGAFIYYWASSRLC